MLGNFSEFVLTGYGATLSYHRCRQFNANTCLTFKQRKHTQQTRPASECALVVVIVVVAVVVIVVVKNTKTTIVFFLCYCLTTILRPSVQSRVETQVFSHKLRSIDTSVKAEFHVNFAIWH